MIRANDEWSVFLLRIPPSVFVSYLEVCRNGTNALINADKLLLGSYILAYIVISAQTNALWLLSLSGLLSKTERNR
jgi:hypothetical protein